MPSFIKLHVTGDFACFTRPEMKVERVSYDILTPSAARGVLEAIYWKPQFQWVIQKIHLLAPIRFTSVRRNEVGKKMTSPDAKMMKGEKPVPDFLIEDERQQRASLLLRDVAYGIEATIRIRDPRFKKDGLDLSTHDNIGKHLGQFERRARSGGHFHQPYLGTREFPANCTWIDQESEFPQPAEPLSVTDLNKDLGFILHDFSFDESTASKGTFIESNQGRRLKATPRFFRAQLKDGVLTVPPLESAIS
jgi:CRISPR-associated protein Cas5d